MKLTEIWDSILMFFLSLVGALGPANDGDTESAFAKKSKLAALAAVVLYMLCLRPGSEKSVLEALGTALHLAVFGTGLWSILFWFFGLLSGTKVAFQSCYFFSISSFGSWVAVSTITYTYFGGSAAVALLTLLVLVVAPPVCAARSYSDKVPVARAFAAAFLASVLWVVAFIALYWFVEPLSDALFRGGPEKAAS